jgi:hypothetical protein
MDLQGVASRDTGLSAQGPLNAADTISYRAMVGAGLNFGNETGDGRKFMGALTWQPSPRWTFDLYADYENTGRRASRYRDIRRTGDNSRRPAGVGQKGQKFATTGNGWITAHVWGVQSWHRVYRRTVI